ncbi:UDP-2,4-diacetamido-2,4,6-trideoxy-beta-L-altropyranose hydrolase [Marinospirillum insulare]|uniref:UDP-2,4-diacetamido-2,4, 6-trideoxy-beta-L-altropyranose hydrolase n=1 Tax=Marinospirillum insulare TaxID=217169 RepID=A0ABQ6A2W0_9GAMM|nr:UDP-2,4-diacetamido-2,4,6-trideoxy-beta-L-altropyranose hydrolase [Marinospirillum insulare]GLR64424.1 UDP-2,4-diacetamido-2,4,6-trideoxy-beta-L-altropyranose hydrolase [Marinospirillum insulare]
MKVTFRVDASLEIGTGHVMRCLTLANALKEQGAECHFICRKHPGNLIETVQQVGFQVHSLTAQKKSLTNNQPPNQSNKEKPLFHAAWLGTTQAQDAEECEAILKQLQPDWLIVDHYALDKTWQQALKPYYKKLMVIDDLGDREHLADLLLDQNYGSTAEKYQNLVPENCKLLTGTHYALLRPEFAQWREYSIKRRSKNTQIKNILITLGGADPDNYTAKILAQLAKSELNPQTEITVIMGATAPHLEAINQQAAALPISTQVKANVSNMAELMSKADLAIGAAGATTWERCCLGLPTIQLVIAENQRKTAQALAKASIVKILHHPNNLPQLLAHAPDWLIENAIKARQITDGLGVERVAEEFKPPYKQEQRYARP